MSHPASDSWFENWSADETRIIALDLFDKATEPVKIIIDTAERCMYVGRGFDHSIIIEMTNNEKRVIG